MLGYLGGPIDQVTKEQANDWREAAERALAGLGVTFYDPNRAYRHGPNYMNAAQAIMHIDRMAIEACDFLVINLMDGLGIGTIREIEYGTSLRKPVFVAYPAELAEHSVWLVDVRVFPNLDVMFTTVGDFIIRKGVPERIIWKRAADAMLGGSQIEQARTG